MNGNLLVSLNIQSLAAVMYCFALQWWGKNISPRTGFEMYFVLFPDVTYVLCNDSEREETWSKAFSNGQIVTNKCQLLLDKCNKIV